MPTRWDRRAAVGRVLGLSGWGAVVASAGWVPAWAGASAAPSAPAPTLLAAWDDEAGRHWAGVLQLIPGGEGAAAWRVQTSIELPTRAHGLYPAPNGGVWVCARRPGEWLLRWWPQGTRPPRWHWATPDRRFTGHALLSPEAPGVLYTVEADQASTQGLLVRRDAQSLAVLNEWPTHGIDPHQALWEPGGTVLLANGGVPTLPETGRTRRELTRMASSLVRLDAHSGALRQQWRLEDARLSLRHLAAHPSGVVGIALQAEHDDPEQRHAAPLLALLHPTRGLGVVAQPQALAGYGGDVLATSAGFAVSAPRAGGVAHWSAQGQWLGHTALTDACALAGSGPAWWALGRQASLTSAGPLPVALPTGLRPDNHAQPLAPGA